jgi:hypothetical protein
MKWMQMMKKNSGTILILFLVMVTIILSSFINSSGREQAAAGKKTKNAEQDNRNMEKAYRQDLREFLCAAGFSNSGITMTRTTHFFEWPDGTTDGTIVFNYTISIHHRKIRELGMDELENLLAEIAGIDLPIEGCTVSYKIL